VFIFDNRCEMTVKERLKEVRINNKLSQTDFADRLNVSRSTLMLIEQGKREINTKILEALKFEFKISSDWMLYGDERDYVRDLNDMMMSLTSSERKLKEIRPFVEELTIIARIKALETQTPQHVQDQKFTNLIQLIYSSSVKEFEKMISSSTVVGFDLKSFEYSLDKLVINIRLLDDFFFTELEPHINRWKTEIITEYWDTRKDKGEKPGQSIFKFDPEDFQ